MLRKNSLVPPGRLRELEIEQLIDSGRGFLADTILFLVFYSPTIDQKEVATVQLMQFIVAIIFLKMFHLISQIRVTHMFEIGSPKFSVKVKLAVLMTSLFTIDLIVLSRFSKAAGRHSTFYTWILFESLSMAAMIFVSFCKYTLHIIDTSLEYGWPGKAAYIFYLDLIGDCLSMLIFLCFMSIFFVQNPSRLPIYMMADILQVARQLSNRLRNFRKYRQIMNDFDNKFRLASASEVKNAETCIICRDDLCAEEGEETEETGEQSAHECGEACQKNGSCCEKKPEKPWMPRPLSSATSAAPTIVLPCTHCFHSECLKSWLVMQQLCPTCRTEVGVFE